MIARVLAASALLVLLVLLGAGCRPRRAPVWYAAAPPPLSCRLKVGEHACIACAKTSCCAESQACEADHRCAALMRCARKPWPFSECTSDERVGPPNDLYLAERACLSAHCPVCPPEHGGSP